MRLSRTVKPISFFKAHAVEIIKIYPKTEKPWSSHKTGEAKAVVQDIRTNEETQESLALLKPFILENSNMIEGERCQVL
ncbi:MAG: antitoxin, Phd family protein [Thermodesulfobacteriota bacterium]